MTAVAGETQAAEDLFATETVVAASADDLIRSVLALVSERGCAYETSEGSLHAGTRLVEMLNVSGLLLAPRARMVRSTVLSGLFNPGLAAARVFFLLSGSDRMRDIAFYTRGVSRFTDDGGLTVPGSAYGSRIFNSAPGLNQFDAVAELLKERTNSKRASMVLYHPGDAGRASRDIPCALSITFSPRDGVLHTNVHMRANNALRLLPYNLFELSLLGEYMARCVGLEPGCYYHSSISMHVVESDIDAAANVAQEMCTPPSAMGEMPAPVANLRVLLAELESQLRIAVYAERPVSVRNLVGSSVDEVEAYWADLFALLAIQAVTKNWEPSSCEKTYEFIESLGLPVSREHAVESRRLATEGLEQR